MSYPTDSIDKLLEQNATYGDLTRMIRCDISSITTAATATCGGQTAQRMLGQFTMPSVHADLDGAFATYFRMSSPGLTGVNMVAGLEYVLGTLTVSGNSFSAGVSMPTKACAENSTPVQTSALFAAIYISTTLTGATTPILTITYTNQDGTGSRTATLTLPSNPVANSMFFLRIHLQSGDTGIRAVTNMSISTGSGGEIKAIGVLPLGLQTGNSISGAGAAFNPLALPFIMPLIETNDVIAVYKTGAVSVSNSQIVFQLNGAST